MAERRWPSRLRWGSQVRSLHQRTRLNERQDRASVSRLHEASMTKVERDRSRHRCGAFILHYNADGRRVRSIEKLALPCATARKPGADVATRPLAKPKGGRVSEIQRDALRKRGDKKCLSSGSGRLCCAARPCVRGACMYGVRCAIRPCYE